MIINKTPHPVHILAPCRGGIDDHEHSVYCGCSNHNDSGELGIVETFPACPKDELIRLRSETVADTPINGVSTSRTVFGEPEGLPAAINGTFFIVSQIVKSACTDRDDLLVPAEVVRDSSGNIIGCRSLGR